MTIELNSFQTAMQDVIFSIVVLLLLHKVSTGPCHQQKFEHDSRGLCFMIKSNITVLKSVIYVHTNHVCYSYFIHI